jgi:hypothetical protein
VLVMAAQAERKAKVDAGRVDTVFRMGDQPPTRCCCGPRSCSTPRISASYAQGGMGPSRSRPARRSPSPNAYTLALPRKARCSPTVRIDRLKPFQRASTRGRRRLPGRSLTRGRRAQGRSNRAESRGRASRLDDSAKCAPRGEHEVELLRASTVTRASTRWSCCSTDGRSAASRATWCDGGAATRRQTELDLRLGPAEPQRAGNCQLRRRPGGARGQWPAPPLENRPGRPPAVPRRARSGALRGGGGGPRRRTPSHVSATFSAQCRRQVRSGPRRRDADVRH